MEAFELTAEAQDSFSGGTIMCSPLGHAFDIKKYLDEGDGVIVTDDPGLAALLTNYPALQRADVPQDAEPVEVPGRDTLQASSVGPWVSQHGDPTYEITQMGGAATAIAPVHVEAEDPTDDPTAEDTTPDDSNPATDSASKASPWSAAPSDPTGTSGQSSDSDE